MKSAFSDLEEKPSFFHLNFGFEDPLFKKHSLQFLQSCLRTLQRLFSHLLRLLDASWSQPWRTFDESKILRVWLKGRIKRGREFQRWDEIRSQLKSPVGNENLMSFIWVREGNLSDIAACWAQQEEAPLGNWHAFTCHLQTQLPPWPFFWTPLLMFPNSQCSESPSNLSCRRWLTLRSTSNKDDLLCSQENQGGWEFVT